MVTEYFASATKRFYLILTKYYQKLEKESNYEYNK